MEEKWEKYGKKCKFWRGNLSKKIKNDTKNNGTPE
jgi:hypothetical protein